MANFPAFGGGAAAIVFGVVAINELVAPAILKKIIDRTGEAGRAEEPAVPVGH